MYRSNEDSLTEMDPEDLPAFLGKIYTTEESRVDLLRLDRHQGVVDDTTLDDDGIGIELPKVTESVVKSFSTLPAPTSAEGSFVLL